jgi:4-hydroxyphenylpyruvate dioxygenase
MRNQLGINGATLPSGDLLTGIHVAAAAGFSYYEPRIPQLVEFDSQQGIRDVQAALAAEALEWLPLNALENVFSATPTEIDRTTHELCALARRFGVMQIIAVPGAVVSPPVSEASDTLHRLRMIAESYGIELLYEFIGFPHHSFPSLSQARQVAKASGFAMVLDTFHLAVSQTAASEIRDMNSREIGLIHLSDAIVGDRSVASIVDEDRVLPDEGGLLLSSFFRSLVDIGYAGPVSVEVFHPKYQLVGPGKGALEAWKRTTAFLASVELPANPDPRI